MRWKKSALVLLCLLTITSCAHPVEQSIEARAEQRRASMMLDAKVSQGACDDVGQFIPSHSVGMTLEASSAPTR
jgi:hypothetical protein